MIKQMKKEITKKRREMLPISYAKQNKKKQLGITFLVSTNSTKTKKQ